MIVYLGSPYTHFDKAVEDERFRQICIVAGRLMQKGYHIFCPIAMAHPINRAVNFGGHFDFWEAFDLAMLNVCNELWVVMLDGWDVSYGLAKEIAFMQRLNRPVYVIVPDTLEKLPLGYIK